MTTPTFKPMTKAIEQYEGHWIVPLVTEDRSLFSYATV